MKEARSEYSKEYYILHKKELSDKQKQYYKQMRRTTQYKPKPKKPKPQMTTGQSNSKVDFTLWFDE